MQQLPRYRTFIADSARWWGFDFRPDDIVISTPPKCGTTWTQVLCGLLIFDGPDFGEPLSVVSPWLDMQLVALDQVKADLDEQQHRRFIKTHTPFDGIPYDEHVAYICVGRDPRDAAISWAHHMTNINEERLVALRAEAVGRDDFGEFPKPEPEPDDPVERFDKWVADDESIGGLRRVVEHVNTFWQRRNLDNVTLFHFSDYKRDLPGQVRRLADALRIDVSPQRAAELAELASFDQLRSDPDRFAPNAHQGIWNDAQGFFHRGADGQWRDALPPESLERYRRRVDDLVDPELARWLHEGWLGGLARQRGGDVDLDELAGVTELRDAEQRAGSREGGADR